MSGINWNVFTAVDELPKDKKLLFTGWEYGRKEGVRWIEVGVADGEGELFDLQGYEFDPDYITHWTLITLPAEENENAPR